MKRSYALIGLALAIVPATAHAAEFWVDPIHGESGNDGSAAAPWRSLQEVLDRGFVESQGWESLPYVEGAELVEKNGGAVVKGGDTIYLRSGYHGDLEIVGFYNKQNITVAAQEGHEPRFRSVLVRASSGWVFRGLHVSPEYAPTYERTTLFDIDSHKWQGPVHDVVVEGSRLQSVADSLGWSASDWDTLSCTGFDVDGKNITIRNNTLKNVNFGITVSAAHSLIEGNVVANFAGDGMRGNGDYSVFQYNTIKNCYAVNSNHDDGFQSFSIGSDGVGTGEVVGVVLRGNTFISYEDPNQPHRGKIQGIGCFAGMFIDWVIENNLIVTDHWHGITMLGARDSRIVNNTVVNPNELHPGPPWIKVASHKNGTPSKNVLVRNNLSTSLELDPQAVVADHNLIIRNPTKLFVDAPNGDFHLSKRARAVDTGSSERSPPIDHDQLPRPWGKGYDVGAYEYREGGIRTDTETTIDKKESSNAVESPPEPAPHDPVDDGALSASKISVSSEPNAPSTAANPHNARTWAAATGILAILVACFFVFIRRNPR